MVNHSANENRSTLTTPAFLTGIAIVEPSVMTMVVIAAGRMRSPARSVVLRCKNVGGKILSRKTRQINGPQSNCNRSGIQVREAPHRNTQYLRSSVFSVEALG
jgi:hypothetical protein